MPSVLQNDGECNDFSLCYHEDEVIAVHIVLWLNSHESDVLRLPAANLHLFQSLLYKLLPPERAAFLHDEGYRVDGKPMKLFAMSWPLSGGRPKFLPNRIELKLPVKLVVSTPVETTLDGLADGALKGDRLRIGSNAVVCERVEARHYQVEGDCIRVRTLSPVTCYSQMQRGDGRRYTVYFSPRDKDFSLSVHNNLIRKFRALYPEVETRIARAILTSDILTPEEYERLADIGIFDRKLPIFLAEFRGEWRRRLGDTPFDEALEAMKRFG